MTRASLIINNKNEKLKNYSLAKMIEAKREGSIGRT
jgi:hypothetical protein